MNLAANVERHNGPSPDAPTLAFVGRVSHQKTRSDQFIIELYQKKFNVLVWRKENISSDQLVQQVLAVQPTRIVYWQIPPSPSKELKYFSNIAVDWAPMADGFKIPNWRRRFSYRRCGLRIIAFSQVIADFAHHYSLSTLRLNYVPAVAWRGRDATPRKALFWYRNDPINLDLVARLIQQTPIDHLTVKGVSQQDLDNFSALACTVQRLPDWLEEAEWLDSLAQCDCFIAPRLVEGIGMSFLYPLMMGKMVLAHPATTMNEYISPEFSGAFFDRAGQLLNDLPQGPSAIDQHRSWTQDRLARWHQQADQILALS